MFKYFIPLEWKAFSRSASFGVDILLRIFFVISALSFLVIFTVLGISIYYILVDSELPPWETINKFLIYYMAADLFMRFFFQKPPIANIKPLLLLNVKRVSLVNYFLGKTVLSIFNTIHFFFIFSLCGVLIYEGFPLQQVLFWGVSLMLMVYSVNFINLLIHTKTVVFVGVVGVVAAVALLQYFQVYDITFFTEIGFKSFYDMPFMIVLPLGLLVFLYKFTLSFYSRNLYLDTGLTEQREVAQSEDLSWLNRFGSVSTFLKNDIKMMKRNKRPKTTVLMSFLFLFYGLLFFTKSIEVYDNDFMYAFSGIFITGGFLLTFGQYVPSWDSSYYPLMMCQNIKYRDYLMAKWWLMVIATALSLVIGSFYLYFGWKVYVLIAATAVFNMGVNSYLVLWGGAYVKTPIDLGVNKNIMGEQQAFNLKTILISIPKMFIPVVIYGGIKTLWGYEAAIIGLTGVGIIGFAFRNRVFNLIENIYKREKYDTLKAYKQKK